MMTAYTQLTPSRPLRHAGWTLIRTLALLAACQVPLAVATPETGSSPDPAQRLRDALLGTPGQRILCPGCPSEPAIRVDVTTGQATEVPLPYERVNDLAPFPGGDRILLATSSEKGRRSQLLVLSTASLAPLGRVEIPGNGERLVVSPDGYAAYVISHRPGRDGDPGSSSGDWELLAVDLGKSAVVTAYPLAGPAYDLTLSADTGRVFLGLDGKIQSFTTSPLTASWFFRSPGKNRRLMVRPRSGQIYALRDAELAIFPPEPKTRKPEDGGSPDDDALRVLEPPVHLDRFGFSTNGRFAVAAGRAMDVLVVVDAVRSKLVGTWPEDSVTVKALLVESEAAEKPKGPRGRLVAKGSGFSPPLGAQEPLSQGNRTSNPSDTESQGGGLAPKSRPQPPDLPTAPHASPPGMVTPDPEAAFTNEKPLMVPGTSRGPAGPLAPEVVSLEEVTGESLRGRDSGDLSLVARVLLFGPNSLVSLRDAVAPGPDGTFSFKLPPPGKYRILLDGRPGTTVVSRPPFQTLDVGGYGFAGIDFSVVGARGAKSP